MTMTTIMTMMMMMTIDDDFHIVEIETYMIQYELIVEIPVQRLFGFFQITAYHSVAKLRGHALVVKTYTTVHASLDAVNFILEVLQGADRT